MKKLYLILILLLIFSFSNKTFSQTKINTTDTAYSCIGTLWDDSGDNWYADYSDNTDDSTLISPTGADYLRLIVDDVDIKGGATSGDTLYIYDGNSSNSPLWKKYISEDINNQNDTLFTTTGNAFIRFTTDGSNNDNGFKIKWKGFFQVTPTITDIACNGDNNGAIDIDDGSRVASYDWNGPDGFTSSSQNLSNIYAGTYNVMITDDNDCEADTSFFVRDSAVVDFTTNNTNLTCFNTGDGEIEITASGGNESYKFYLEGTGWTAGFESNPYTYSGLSASEYDVQVEDGNGCQSTIKAQTITEPTEIIDFLFYGDNEYCAGESVTLNLEGSQIGVDYQLRKNTTDTILAKSGTGALLSWPDLPKGSYDIVATQTSSGCTRNMGETIVVVENPLPTVTINNATICNGETHTITADAGFDYYAWSNGYQGDETVARSIDVTAANTYSVTVTDANGCQDNDDMLLTVNALPTVFDVTGPDSYCDGTGGVILSLNNTVDADIDYQLSNNNGDTLAAQTGSSANLTWTGILKGTNFSVLATNTSTNCQSTMNGSIDITENPLPDIHNFSALASSYCSGSNGVTMQLDDSQSGINYQLSNDDGDTLATVVGINAPLEWNNVLKGTNYNVTATDASTSCASTMAGGGFDITIDPLPNAYNVISAATEYCANSNGITISLDNSDDGVQYQLLKDGGNDSLITSSGGGQLDWVKRLAGTYTITAFDGTCSNDMNGSIELTQYPAITNYLLSAVSNSYCAGTDGVDLQLSGSQSGVNYQLKNDGVDTLSAIAGTGSAIFWQDIKEGTYTVVATNPTTGCSLNMSGSEIITIDPLPTAFNVTGTGEYCIGSGGLEVGLDDTESGVDYQLYKNSVPGSTISGTDNAISYGFKLEGLYTIVATNATTSCTNTMTGNANIVENPLPVVSLNDGQVCENDTYTFDAGAGYASYLWSCDSTTQTFDSTFTNIAATTILPFTVTVTDANGCQNSASMNLTVDTLPDVSITNIADLYNYNDDPIQVIVSPSGGDLTASPKAGALTGDNVFYPDLADTTATNVLLYEFTDNEGCFNSTTHDVDVVTNLGRIESLKEIYCYDEPIDPINGLNNDTANIKGDFFIGDENGRIQIASNTNYASIDPAFLGPGTDTVIYRYTDGIVFNVKRIITVDSVGIVDFQTLDSSYCSDDGQVLLAAFNLYPSGGTGVFTGGPTLGGFNDNGNNTAYLFPDQVDETELNTEYTIQYVYESPLGCFSSPVTKPVTIYDLPDVSFEMKEIFNTEEDPVTVVPTPDGGVFTGVGMTNDVFTPSVSIAQNDIVITYTYTEDTTGCTSFDRDTVDVLAAKTVITNLSSTYCYDDSTFTITAVNDPLEVPILDALGAFTSAKNGLTDNLDNTATYSLVDAGAGIDTVRYTYFMSGTEFWVDYIIAIDSIASLDFLPLDTLYCQNDALENIFATVNHPNGTGAGNFSGISASGFINNGNSAILIPGQVPAGNYEVKYLYTSTWQNTGCQDSLVKPVTIYEIPTVEFSLKDEYSVLETQDGIQLTGTPTGGTFSGILSGVAELTQDGKFTAQAGDYIITYTYTDPATTCTNFATDTTEVRASSTNIVGQQSDYIYCFDVAASDTLVGSASDGQPGGSFSGNPGTDYITNLGPDSCVFNPVAAGEGIHTIFYTYWKLDGSTQITISRDVEVEEIGNVDFDDFTDHYCDNGNPFTINAINPEDEGTGVFSGPPTGFTPSTGFAIIDPTAIGATADSIDITYTFTSAFSGCKKSKTKKLFINPRPVIDFVFKDVYNISEGRDTIITSPPISTGYSETTFDNDAVTSDSVFNPSLAGLSTGYPLTYLYTDELGCSNTITKNTKIKQSAGSINTSKETYCFNNPIDTITWNPDPDGDLLVGSGYFEGAGITDIGNLQAIFDAVAAGPGTHTITYFYYKKGTVDSALFETVETVRVEDQISFEINGLDDQYCKNSPDDDINSSVQNSAYEFVVENWVSDNGDGTGVFIPSGAAIGKNYVELIYTSVNGCETRFVDSTVIIDLTPLDFSLKDIYNVDGEPDTLITTPPISTGGSVGLTVTELNASQGISSDSIFSPNVVGINPDFTVQYIYVDENNCVNTLEKSTNIKQSAGSIIGFKEVYCYNNPIDTISWNQDSDQSYIEGSGYFTGNAITDMGNKKAVFDPVEAGPGEHQITYYYYKRGSNDSALFSTSASVQVESEVMFSIDMEEDTLCIRESEIELEATGDGFTGTEMRFSGNGVIDQGDKKGLFDPNNANLNLGYNMVTLTFTSDNSGCKKAITDSIFVLPLPKFDFEVTDRCIDDSVQFIALPVSDSIVQYEWDFGEPAATSEEQNPSWKYSIADDYEIELTAYYYKYKVGCDTTITKTITTDDAPIADFEWLNECLGSDPVQFTNQTSGITSEATYIWDFGDGNTSGDANTSHVYQNAGSFDVKLTANTTNGCSDDTIQIVNIREHIKLNELGEYLADFNDDQDEWYIDTRNSTNSTWAYGIPSGISIASDNPVWATNLTGSYNNDEHSWIISPCFDFTDVLRPMIRFDFASDLGAEETDDGIVLQYTIDDGITWNVIGNLGDGINWYNHAPISGNPGNQELNPVGWSYSTNNNEWMVSKHDLNALKNREKVQLRFAFGSNLSDNATGIAIDNIWIGQKSRKVLLEHFTNNSDPTSATVNANTINKIANKYPLDVIDIQYHTSIPGEDALNIRNPFPPSARRLYYGISTVPYSIMDGMEFYDYSSNSFTENDLKLRVLEDPQFDLDLETTINSNTLGITATLTSLMDTTEMDISLFVAVIEKMVTGINANNGEVEFESVMVDMIPDAGGTNYRKSWAKNDTETASLSWEIDHIDDLDEMIVVAFIQNNSTLEVYQAETTDTTTVSTGLYEFLTGGSDFDFFMYPNPARDNVQLLLKNPVVVKTTIEIYNYSGRLVDKIQVPKGSNYVSFDTGIYDSGMYLIKAINSRNQSIVKKLIVQ